MKNILSLLVITLMLGACGSTKEVKEEATTDAPAIENRGATSGERTEGLPNRPRRTGMDPEQMVAQLNMDEEQEIEFLEFWEQNTAKMKEMRESFKDDRTGMREKMMELREERNAGLKEILSEEQMAQYQEIMSKNRKGRGMRGGRGGGRG